MEAVISKHPLFIATNAIAGGGIARPENPLATLEGAMYWLPETTFW